IDNELVGRTEWLDGKVDPEAWNKTHSVEDYASKFKPPHQDLVIGEKSADILLWKQSHPRLAEYLPHCKFIIQLRNPISRAYSHYWNDFGKGRESLSFEEALSVEDDRSQGSDYARHHLSYKERGCYDESLKSFFQHLPRENVLVLIMEETLEDPKKALKRIYKFIGVDPTQGMDLIGSKHNVNWTMVPRKWAAIPPFTQLEMIYRKLLRKIAARLWRNDPDRQVKKRKFFQRTESVFRKPAANLKIAPEVQDSLRELYKPHIQQLERMLDIQLKAWY
ncbi:MAG: sulfotransferase, partial [Bacteroidetes bacterium]|nr:sulfotransferase [Bacteroidota bacterium]